MRDHVEQNASVDGNGDGDGRMEGIYASALINELWFTFRQYDTICMNASVCVWRAGVL